MSNTIIDTAKNPPEFGTSETWLAASLRSLGFQVIRTETRVNDGEPQVWFFFVKCGSLDDAVGKFALHTLMVNSWTMRGCLNSVRTLVKDAMKCQRTTRK
jgi:hypothetical protein